MSRVIINSENRITQKYKPLTHKGVDLGHARELHDPKNEVYQLLHNSDYRYQGKNPKSYNGQDYKSTVYQTPIDQRSPSSFSNLSIFLLFSICSWYAFLAFSIISS